MATGGSKLWVPGQSFASFFADNSHTVSPREDLEIEDFDITTLEAPMVGGPKMKEKLSSNWKAQPARSLVGTENEGETLSSRTTQNHTAMVKSTVYLRRNHRLVLFFLGICQGITRSNTQCRKKVKIWQVLPFP